MGVSPNGVDVYFSTYDTLVPQDENGAFLKFYDARTGGGFDFTPESPPCEAADECHGAGSTPWRSRDHQRREPRRGRQRDQGHQLSEEAEKEK